MVRIVRTCARDLPWLSRSCAPPRWRSPQPQRPANSTTRTPPHPEVGRSRRVPPWCRSCSREPRVARGPPSAAAPEVAVVAGRISPRPSTSPRVRCWTSDWDGPEQAAVVPRVPVLEVFLALPAEVAARMATAEAAVAPPPCKSHRRRSSFQAAVAAVAGRTAMSPGARA